MSKFVYFEYRGTRAPTIQSSYREPYHYVVEVSKKESDGHDRSPDELKNAAAIVIRSSLVGSIAEILIATPHRKEITRREFDAMETENLNPTSSMPGGVYEVITRRYGSRS
ncbi:MAG: hypothetical protein JO331_02180 [Verrucomicrobia bacterium]|nr:hypothetical protein [Verrucomicrobiota bacterium]